MRRPNPALLSDDALAVWNAAQRTDVSDPIAVKCTLMTPMYGGGVEPGKVDRASCPSGRARSEVSYGSGGDC